MDINLFWIEKHYRFGLAGEGQANMIARILHARRGKVLNIGCGPQPHHVVNLSYHCELLIAADHEIRMISSACRQTEATNIRFIVADAYDLPLTDGSLDHIVALGVFGYIRDPAGVFREFRRVTGDSANVMLTNSVAHPKEPLLKAALAAGFTLAAEKESFCPAASGPVKMRYLLVFTRSPSRHKPTFWT